MSEILNNTGLQMEIKKYIDKISNNKILPVNIARVDLKNKEKDSNTKIEIHKSIIKLASDIFTRDLMEYLKSGGNLNNLTSENVYSKIRKDCWTSSKKCDMCLLDKKGDKE